jgi:signal peptidase II
VKPVRFYLLAVIIVALDQLTKWVVQARLPLNNVPVPAVGRFLYLTHTRNTGGAFSLFQAGNTMFIVVAIAAIIAFVYAYHKMKRTDLAVTAALALALGGAIGNLIDRVRFGFVVDFFDIQAGTGHSIWPIFNVADSAITVGIVLLAFHFLFAKNPADQGNRPAEREDEPNRSSGPVEIHNAD